MNNSLVVICSAILSFSTSIVFIRVLSENINVIISFNALSMLVCFASMIYVFKYVKSTTVRNLLAIILFIMFINHLLTLVYNVMLLTNAKKYGIIFFAIDPYVIYNFNRASLVLAFIAFVTGFTLNN
jgi:hypothetical protein